MPNTCILCGGALSGPSFSVFDNRFGIKELFKYKTCSDCLHIQIDPLIDKDKLNKFYNDHYNSIEKIEGGKYSKVRGFINSSFLKIIYNYFEGDISYSLKKGSGKLLEIGCNEGKNLVSYHSNGFETYGLETNKIAAESAKKLGFKIFTDDILDLSLNHSFDVIVLPNVLEHLLDHISSLNKVKMHLNENGELWIILPNSNSIFRKMFRNNWINWHPPFHISHFNPKNLEDAIQKSGFSISSLKSVSPPQWISMSIISRLSSIQGKPNKELRNPLLLTLFMIFIMTIGILPLIIINRLMIGDCLKLVAKDNE